MDYGKLSVIVPVYNAEQYIGHCIKSILNQSYKNIELIIVDDGSNDSTLRICKKFQDHDDRVKIIVQENKGVSAARNVGLDRSEGIFIGFVDGDDIVSHNMYECMISAMIEEDVDVVDSRRKIFYNEQVITILQRKYESYSYTVIDKEIENPTGMLIKFSDISNYEWACCSKVFRKQAISHIRFNGHNGEDAKFILDLIVLNRSFVLLNNVYYYYRKSNPTSTTASFKLKTLDIIDFYVRFSELLECHGQNNLSSKWKSKKYILMLNYYSRLKFSNVESKKVFMENYLKAIKVGFNNICNSAYISWFYKINFRLFLAMPCIVSSVNFCIGKTLDFKRFIDTKKDIFIEKIIIKYG